MSLLAIDIGTTHCKAGLFRQDGSTIKIASRDMKLHQSSRRWVFFDPAELIALIIDLLKTLLQDQPDPIAAVGIASMAETGLLVDRTTGAVCTGLIPWLETASQPTAEQLLSKSDPLVCYQKFGLKATYKASLVKILWLKETQNLSMENKVWLSTADFVVWWLTGKYQTDLSLASRTLAYRVDSKAWDHEWLRGWDLPPDLFPPALTSGTIAGAVIDPASGLPIGTPVAVCGHDHVCAALATGAIHPGTVFDSMGTAETLIGALPERNLTSSDYDNGLLYGCHTAPGMGYWLGGLSASGGSVEWFRSQQKTQPQSYEDLDRLLKLTGDAPTGILYFPYLLGSGSPHTQPSVRGAMIGLSAWHTAGDLYKAILEGTAFELEIIRRAGETMSGEKITTLKTAGGGTRNRAWLQIKADVTGCSIHAANEPEATLLGAAILAGVGVGIYQDVEEALAQVSTTQSVEFITPNWENHVIYQTLFENGYLSFQEPLRKFGDWTQQSYGEWYARK